MSDLEQLANFAGKTWYEKRGLIAALIVTFATSLATMVSVQMPIVAITIIEVTICAGIFIAWMLSRRPRKCPTEKIGFLTSIACSDDKVEKKLQEDFIQPLRTLIKSGTTGPVFCFMELPQFLARTIVDLDQAEVFRQRCAAHFMIYGRVRIRQINGNDCHVIELNGIVAHAAIPEKIHKMLQEEFSELLPRRLHIPVANDILSFQFTSEWAEVVARYVIALAATVSGDFDYAEALLRDVIARLSGRDHTFPAFKLLSERAPQRISELYSAKAQFALDRWTDSRSPEHLDEIERCLQQLSAPDKETPVAVNLMAMLAFLRFRDTERAISLMRRSNSPSQLVWHVNLAFLYAYGGNLKLAIRHYRKASEIPPQADWHNVIAQVESFMVWLLEVEPEKVQI